MSNRLKNKVALVTGGNSGIGRETVRRFVEEGDAAAAAEHLRPEMAEDNPSILLAIAEIQLRGGHEQKAVELVRRSLTKDHDLAADAREVPQAIR